MFRITALAIIGSLISSISLSQTSKPTEKDVPVIDREVFFGNPEIAGGQLSPDGKWISFLKVYNGTLNIWVKKFDEAFDKAKPLTNNERPIGGYFWTNDSKYILFVKDKGGNENYHVYAVDPQAAAAEGGVPVSRDLTPNDKVRAAIYQVSKKQPNLLWVGLNDRDPSWHDLYQLDINTGKLTLLRKNEDRISGWLFDWDEKLRLALRNPEDGSTEILRVDADKLEKIYSVGPLESIEPVGFNKTNKSLYMSTNKGASVDLSKLVLLDPATGSTTDVESDPLKKVDFGGASLSDVTHELVLTTYTDEKERKYWKSKDWEADYNLLRSKFPDREISMANSTADERKLLVSIYGDKYASEIWFFNRDTKQLLKQYVQRPKLKAVEQYLSPMQPITYKSSDGLAIPAYLTLPAYGTGKNLPLLVFPHGGPWARDNWGYHPYAQFFANRGFAVLMMNFRGSTGYGKNFLDAGNLEWGLKMQDDITWGVKYLVQQGIADTKKVAIMGGSYGGYATLAGLAFTPDLYAAGVDIVGPSNLFTLLSTIPPYWEAGRKIFSLRMGDENTEAGKAVLQKASPLFSADKIKAPLLIVQGANDPRVKKAESDQIVVALRGLGRDVQYIMADDEGHGFAKPVNNMAMIAASEKFLAPYCGTRYQPEMPDDVAKRLKEITVDVAAVKLAEKSGVSLLDKLPAPSLPITAGTYQYGMVIEVQGQTIPMEASRTVTVDANKWTVADKATTPMGDVSDENEFGANSLQVIKRKIKQGPADVSVDYSNPETVMTAMGNIIKVKATGAILADGAGNDMVIARLPLKEGYTAALQQLDAQTGKFKTMNIAVLGSETINGVDCWKVKADNADNPAETGTFWLDKVRGIAVKGESVAPAMGNAKITMTLK